jgi:hypothetical protein
LCKNKYKRQRKKEEWKGSAEMNLWTKVHGLSQNPVAPVSVGSTRYTRDLPGFSLSFTPFTPPLSPTTQNSKRREREGDFLAIWGFHQGFQGLEQDLGPPTRLDWIPLHS